MIPTVGMKIRAILAEGDGYPVYGVITNVEPLILEETDEVLSEHFPTITLDNGKIVNGMECWWSPVDEEIQNEEENEFIRNAIQMRR